MSRISRLELVVANLAKRILGDELTFDQIAEAEADAQGVAYTPPAPIVQEVDTEAIVQEVLARVPKPEPVAVPAPAEIDVSPLYAELAELKERLSAVDRRHVTQEHMLQTVVQAADALLQRLNMAEAEIDAHRQSFAIVSKIGEEVEKKLGAA